MSWSHGEGHVKSHTYNTLQNLFNDRDKVCLKRTRTQVFALRDGDVINIRLHDTDIMTYYPDGVIELNSGGWKTMLTKNRMNDLLPKPWRVFADKGVWYVSAGNSWGKDEPYYVFEDGMLLYPDLTVEGAGDEYEQVQLRKRINKYAKRFADAFMRGEIQSPDLGDCLMCKIAAQNESFDNVDHLESHMAEDYFVPTLLVVAMNSTGAPPITKQIVQDFWDTNEFRYKNWKDYAAEWVQKSVRKYMLHQLGLSA